MYMAGLFCAAGLLRGGHAWAGAALGTADLRLFEGSFFVQTVAIPHC